MPETSNIVPNKQLGQHWLNDPADLLAICDLAELDSSDVVLEIGPGLGSLTSLLITRARQLVAVEYDASLIAELKSKFADASNLSIVNEDIRSYNLSALPPGYKVVANIPYYLSGYILRLLTQSSNPPKIAVLLMQQEVALRLAAAPGDLSVLGVLAQVYWEVSLGPLIKSEKFTPPPKVDSRVVKLIRLASPLVDDSLAKQFFRLVKIGFSQKRKTLANNLSAGMSLNKDRTNQLLVGCGLNSLARPQELSIEQWLSLAQALFTEPT